MDAAYLTIGALIPLFMILCVMLIVACATVITVVVLNNRARARALEQQLRLVRGQLVQREAQLYDLERQNAQLVVRQAGANAAVTPAPLSPSRR